MITGPVLCACFRAVFVSRVCLVCGYCVARCLTCGLVEAPQSARSPAGPADHTAPPNLSVLCDGVLFSCLGVHAGELFRVTNVVNLSNILCASWAIVTNVVNPPVISPEIGYFGLDLTTFVTGPCIERLKMLRFDDVCNIGRPGRDRPHRRSRFRGA